MNGGAGLAFYGTYYAGGGGGGKNGATANGAGGNGGGGSGNTNGNAGTHGLGGGGGGGFGGFGNNTAGARGGSGVVILRYPDVYTLTVAAGHTASTITSGSTKITTITVGSGSVSWS